MQQYLYLTKYALLSLLTVLCMFRIVFVGFDFMQKKEKKIVMCLMNIGVFEFSIKNVESVD